MLDRFLVLHSMSAAHVDCVVRGREVLLIFPRRTQSPNGEAWRLGGAAVQKTRDPLLSPGPEEMDIRDSGK
jgi:hypothetical protein